MLDNRQYYEDRLMKSVDEKYECLVKELRDWMEDLKSSTGKIKKDDWRHELDEFEISVMENIENNLLHRNQMEFNEWLKKANEEEKLKIKEELMIKKE